MRAHTSLHGDEPGAGAGPPLLYNLVYCSRATPEVDDAAVQRIIATARRCNPAQGITGMLVYGGGIFFQWLEGPRHQVLALMAALRQDTRHEQIVQLSEVEEARERLFPDWDMELVTAEHVREVLEDALDNASDPQNEQALRRMLAELDTAPLSGLSAA